MKTINMVGQVFGSLTVTAMLPGAKCQCNCACGTVAHVTQSYSVRKGLARTCGCGNVAGHPVVHGEARAGHWTPEYRAWVNMLTRCYNPKSTRFENWGGRGVGVSPAWRHDYPAFLAAVGRRPSDQHSLDRYPNTSGDYEPGNVRWATAPQQSRNQRSNMLISAFGKTMILVEWAEATGIRASVLRDRIVRGWNPEKALTAPVKVAA